MQLIWCWVKFNLRSEIVIVQVTKVFRPFLYNPASNWANLIPLTYSKIVYEECCGLYTRCLVPACPFTALFTRLAICWLKQDQESHLLCVIASTVSQHLTQVEQSQAHFSSGKVKGALRQGPRCTGIPVGRNHF